ncbi:MAG TPA: hypothetical protein VK489_06825 [Ferruginibacter sp.]|nr:hypothetical protein [Ferruginibacter sp.]
MKKTIIASIVGGIIIFAWQFLSWPVLNLHKATNRYTPNGSAILENLNANLPEEGGYILPGLPETATSEDHEKMMKESDGKPWASVQYHKTMKSTVGAMVTNMIRALLVDIVMIMLFCWILNRFNMASFRTIFIASIFTGLIIFFYAPYTMNIWYKTFDVMAHFCDAIISWGLCGLWLGWYLSRKPVNR